VLFLLKLQIRSGKSKALLLDEPLSGLASGQRYMHDVTDQLYVLVNGKTYPVSDDKQLITLGYLNEL
jgi:hypothetical protein